MSYPGDIKEKARTLRRKGFSIIQIAQKLSIAKSTTSLWVRDVPLPKNIQKLLAQREMTGREKGLAVLKAKRMLALASYHRDADQLFRAIRPFAKKKLLHLLCAIIFWCEGSKRRLSELSLTNSDPALIKFFLHALRSAFPIQESKFRVVLHLHEYHFVKKQILFWSKTTGVPLAQFSKPYCKPNTGKRVRENYQGCASIRYRDASIAKRLDALYHSLAGQIM